MESAAAQTIPIVISLDRNYAPYAKVMLRSLFAHRAEHTFYKIIVLMRDHDTEIQHELTEFAAVQKNWCTIRFMEVPRQYLESRHFHVSEHVTEAAYYRLFIPSLLPEYDRVLYLDIDLVITGDVSELYRIDMKDHYLAAVPDVYFNAVPEMRRYAEQTLGVPANRPYFNDGILLMDLGRCRQDNMEEKFLSALAALKTPRFHDQCVLNASCSARTLLLDYCWNFQVQNLRPLLNPAALQTPPKIIHYIGHTKPWHYPNVSSAAPWRKFSDLPPPAAYELVQPQCNLSITV